MTEKLQKRQMLVAVAGVAAAGALLTGRIVHAAEEIEVTANEDLMREHGVIRRALLVYQEAARRLQGGSKPLPLKALGDTTRLLREFAEDYHERALEEAHIFPVVRKLKSAVAKLPDTLLQQHRRGRDITDYVRQMAAKGTISTADAGPLAQALEGFVAMYEPHAAREDTELFPAWKEALGAKAYAEMGERFDEIEHKTFGRDGFDDAMTRIARIEMEFGLADLDVATAQEPPRAASKYSR